MSALMVDEPPLRTDAKIYSLLDRLPTPVPAVLGCGINCMGKDPKSKIPCSTPDCYIDPTTRKK